MTIYQKFIFDFYNFSTLVWGSDRERGFQFGTKYGFFNVAKKSIELGAEFYKTIVKSDHFQPLILDRIANWQMSRGHNQDDVIGFFDKQGVYDRSMYNELLRKSIKARI